MIQHPGSWIQALSLALAMLALALSLALPPPSLPDALTHLGLGPRGPCSGGHGAEHVPSCDGMGGDIQGDCHRHQAGVGRGSPTCEVLHEVLHQ